MAIGGALPQRHDAITTTGGHRHHLVVAQLGGLLWLFLQPGVLEGLKGEKRSVHGGDVTVVA
jgi:hypothetical protein